MSATNDTQTVHWTLPRDDLDALRELARQQDRSITATAKRAIREYTTKSLTAPNEDER